jgi:hypothetical protein
VLNNAIAIDAQAGIIGDFGTVSNAYAVKAAVLQLGTGTLSNVYGVYIDSMPAGLNSTYAFYQAGVNDNNYFAGKVGIGAANPTAALDVAGHIANSGAAASVDSCGSGPTITGNDARGSVLTGAGGVSSCVITFSSAYATAPICVATWSGSASATGIGVASTTTTLTVSFSASSPSMSFNYICLQ